MFNSEPNGVEEPAMQHTVRYFIMDYDTADGEFDLIEVDEHQFLSAEGKISYERHTVAENGVSQICLSKFY